MSIVMKAWHLGQQVLLTIPDGSLVYDGKAFTKPENAEYILLIDFSEATFDTPGHAHIPSPDVEVVSALMKNTYYAQVIDSTPLPDQGQPPDVIDVPDPGGGECICGVTCMATEIKYVQVTHSVLTPTPLPVPPPGYIPAPVFEFPGSHQFPNCSSAFILNNLPIF